MNTYNKITLQYSCFAEMLTELKSKTVLKSIQRGLFNFTIICYFIIIITIIIINEWQAFWKSLLGGLDFII